jgi:CHASE1-domain containing sensor protein
MKSWKEAAQAAVAIAGVAVTVSYGYAVTRQCQRVERDRVIARLAIDNTPRIAAAVDGGARILGSVSDADSLDSFHDVVMYASFPQTIGTRPAAVLKAGDAAWNYVRETGDVGADRVDGGLFALTSSQPSQRKTENVVEYLSKKVVAWVVR